MALHTIFGINGVGKDTVAERLRERHSNILVSGQGRLTMYCLGIIDDYDSRSKVTEEHYRQLEEVPLDDRHIAEETSYRKFLENAAESSTTTIFLSHLVVAYRHGSNMEYITEDKTYDWLIMSSKSLTQLIAPPETISQRRRKDTSRIRKADLDEVIRHQSLCDTEWSRISRDYPEKRSSMHRVENIDLGSAVAQVDEIIFGE